MEELIILGAAYGPADVTAIVQSLVQGDTLTVTANNETFTDTWPDKLKSLAIVYQYSGQSPQVLILPENETETISPPVTSVPMAAAANPCQLTILGAAYGLGNVTDIVQNLIIGGYKVTAPADNEWFSDTWVDVEKTLVIVYSYSSVPQIKIAMEHETITIVPTLQILGATYGPEDVTAKVSAMVANEELNITPSNDLFGDDPLFGYLKSFAVVYQYETEQPITAIVEENTPISIAYTSGTPFSANDAPVNELFILGAAYGLGDVTTTARELASFSQLSVTADNATFTDTWPNVVKTLTVVYQYGNGTPRLAACVEEAQLDIEYSGLSLETDEAVL